MKKKYDFIDQTPWDKVLYDHISIYFVSSDFLKTFEDMKFLLNVLLGPHCGAYARRSTGKDVHGYVPPLSPDKALGLETCI